MIRATIVFVIAVLALTAALPADNVVPESPAAAHSVKMTPEEHHAHALLAVKELAAQGTDDNACRELSESTKSEVQNEVDSLQAIIDGLDDGSNCHEQGQGAVEEKQNAKDQADQDVIDRQQDLTDAQNAPVEYGSVAYSALTPGSCDMFFSGNDNYNTAHSNVVNAQTALDNAEGAAAAAQTALDDALAEQVELVNTCRCNAKSQYDTAWENAIANADDREKTYTQAEHMICVLDEKSTADCSVTVPTVTPRDLPSEVSGVTGCASGGMAMSINGNLYYDDAIWTNTELLDDGTNTKTDAYMTPANVLILKNVEDSTEVRWEHNLNLPLNDIMAGNYDSTIGITQWHNLVPGAGIQNHCNVQGTNKNYNYVGRCRFCLMMNQENDCGSCDSTIGVGFDTFVSGRSGAGAFCTCCQNSGTCSKTAKHFELWVE